jgi:hypothetical protein
MTEGAQLKQFIDNQAKSKISIASDLGMSKQNLYGLFKSKLLSQENKDKFEAYFGKSIFTSTNITGERDEIYNKTNQSHSRPLTEAEGIEFLKQHIQTLKENDAWMKKVFETNLTGADSDRVLIMRQLTHVNKVAAQIFAKGNVKTYDDLMAEYRKSLVADGEAKP